MIHTRGVAHVHGHRLPDDAITRSRAGLRAVFIALLILALAAAAQALVSSQRARSRCWPT
jgi:hypothetical protein